MRFERIAPQREVGAVDFSDLTDSVRTGPAYWDPESPVATLVIPTDREPTPDEARAVRRRLVTTDDGDEAQLLALLDAHDDPATPAWARPLIAAELARYGEPA